ncbi:MAG: hypothetical protein A4S17_10690 [Proteobacteria bacterium HN_bin10]|nr:MAG: hypothetical protein A4S17_10690 [Proteobacteria bacterium HN_bin10]
MHSLGADLTMAPECLDALEKFLAARSDNFNQVITEAALLSSAILPDVRGTNTASRERRKFDLLSKFGDEQKAIHKELCDLRNKAIAHFGSGGCYQGEWQIEQVILQCRGEEAKVGVVTRRKTIDKDLVKRARAQIEFSHALLRAAALQRIADVTEELKRASDVDPNLLDEIERHPLNLSVFLTSPTRRRQR